MAEKRFAILIASSRFPEEPGLTALRGPENDVDALAEVLRSPDFGQFSEVVPLKNRPSHVVLERLETLLHEAGREDLVLVYFSGHGKLNASGQLCLATANTKLRALGSTFIPVERASSPSLTRPARRRKSSSSPAATAARRARSSSKAAWMTSFSSCLVGRAPSS